MSKKYLMTEAELLMLLHNSYNMGAQFAYCEEPDEEWYKAHEYREKTCEGCKRDHFVSMFCVGCVRMAVDYFEPKVVG